MAALKHGIPNSETETEFNGKGNGNGNRNSNGNRNGICERRFQAIDLKKKIAMTKK